MLPKNWVQTRLGDLATFEMGQAPPGSASNFEGHGTIFVKAGEFGANRPIIREWTTAPKKFASEKDVLICVVGATAGKLNLGIDCAIGRSVAAIKPSPAVQQKILYYQLQTKVLELRSGSTGSAQGVISREMLFNVDFVLPPYNEQQLIADKLETIFDQVDSCCERLNRVPTILKRFREAVLAAATTGNLTEDWRGKNSSNGEWSRIKLGQVAKDFSYGSAAKSSKSGAVPVLRMGNIQEGRLDWNDLVYTSDPQEIEKYRLAPGDVLFNRTNSPELVGKTAVFNGEREAVYAGYLIRIRCSQQLLPDYLNYCLGSPAGRDYCWQVKSDGVSQSNINAKKLAAFELLLPSVDEQHEIIRRVESLFGYTDRLEAHYSAARYHVEKLTQALLARAFRGELVQQDPNDEPASILLERIRAARAVMPNKKTRKKIERKASMDKPTVNSIKSIIEQMPQNHFSFDELRSRTLGDYEGLKDIVFALLSEVKPILRQVFDENAGTMHLEKVSR